MEVVACGRGGTRSTRWKKPVDEATISKISTQLHFDERHVVRYISARQVSRSKSLHSGELCSVQNMSRLIYRRSHADEPEHRKLRAGWDFASSLGAYIFVMASEILKIFSISACRSGETLGLFGQL